MNHFQMQLKMQYEVRVVEMLLLDFSLEQVLEFTKLYSRYMASQWERGESFYETARFILNENYASLSAYQYIND